MQEAARVTTEPDQQGDAMTDIGGRTGDEVFRTVQKMQHNVHDADSREEDNTRINRHK